VDSGRPEAEEILHIRHHSLYTPRDFDLSPYFRIVKPTIEANFDYHALSWYEDGTPARENPAPAQAAGRRITSPQGIPAR
jgi:hypothetical protein